MSIEDQMLLGRWSRERDAEAFRTIASRYAGMVYGTCRRILDDLTEAEDVTQECFEDLARAGTRPGAFLGPWLHRVATNRCLKRIRSERRRKHRERQYADKLTATRGEVTWNDVYFYVDEAVQALPDKLRVPVVAHFFDNQTHESIAETLGVSRQVVTYRVGKGIERVRKSLVRAGVSVSAVALASLLQANTASAAPATLLTGLGRLALAGPGALPATTTLTGMLKSAASWKIAALVAMVATTSAIIVGAQVFTEDRPSVPKSAPPVRVAQETPQAPAAEPDESSGTAPTAESVEVTSASTLPDTATPPPRSISGRVYDERDGAGIPDAKIVLEDYTGNVIRPANIGKSDTEGRYCLQNVPDGNYNVEMFEAGGYTRKEIMKFSVIMTRGKPIENVDFALGRGTRISGIVLSPDGTPAANAYVCGKLEKRFTEGASSGPNGKFEIFLPGVGPGLYLQAASKEHISEILGPLTLTEEGLQGLELRLISPKNAAVSGKIVDDTGNGMANATVVLSKAVSDNLMGSGRAVCAEDGSFKIAAIAPGAYDIFAIPVGVKGYGLDDKVADEELAEGQHLDGLVLVLGDKGGLCISGRVTDSAGKPVANASVDCFGKNISRTASGSGGRFLVTGLEEGAYSISAHKEGYTGGGAQGVTAGSENVEVVLSGTATIEGRVIRADTGKPITRFEVFHSNGIFESFRAEMLRNSRNVQNSEGRFVLTGVPVDEVTVSVQASGFTTAFQPVEVQEGGTANIEFHLQATQSLTGKVVGPSGEPVSAATIVTGEIWSLPPFTRRTFIQTVADGSFVVDSLPALPTKIHAWHADYGAVSAEITAVDPSRPLTLVFPESGTLEVLVTEANQPRPGTNVSISCAETLPPLSLHGTTDDSGSFTFSGVRPGQIRVSAGAPAAGTSCCVVTAIAGQTTRAEIALLSGTGIIEGQVQADQVTLEIRNADLTVDTGNLRYGAHALVGNNGMFRFDGVPAGIAHLTVYASQSGSDASEQRDVEFPIAEGETVQQIIAF